MTKRNSNQQNQQEPTTESATVEQNQAAFEQGATPAESEQQKDQAPAKGDSKRNVVADGKSLTSKRGILRPGDEVLPEYLNGGDRSLKNLIEAGHVVKG